MCLALPARVIALHGQDADVELYGGNRVVASTALHPNVAAGQFVLMDRGLILQIIDEAEAEALLAMYEEIGQMLEADLASS